MFSKNQVYRRKEIHDRYGGGRQGGISTPAKVPHIFIFSGSSGQRHGYVDKWVSNTVYAYSGEGQVGDMQFVRGNLALRDHLTHQKRVFLFEYVRRAYVKFVDELTFDQFIYDTLPDSTGSLRNAIIFYFRRISAKGYQVKENEISTAEDESPEYNFSVPESTERSGIVRARVGQNVFRRNQLYRWNHKCAVTGFNDSRILVASHILPWKDSTDDQRMDIDNGILLSPDFDALFDRHLISFEPNGMIILSSSLNKKSLTKLGITGKEKITNLSEGNKTYLEQHNVVVTNFQ